MRYLSLLLITICFSVNVLAQQVETKNLNVGDYILIKPCAKNAKEILSMDIYSRTNAYNKLNVDTLTGDGLFEEFFKDESIDAKPLPCVMSGKKYKVAALNEFNVEGKTKRVVLCYTNYHLNLIWIEFDKALQNQEISF